MAQGKGTKRLAHHRAQKAEPETTNAPVETVPVAAESASLEETTHPHASRRPGRSPRSRFTDEYGIMLVQARVDAGIQQKEIAQRIGKTRSHISMVEAREREASFVDIFRWVRALGLEFGDFAHQLSEEIERRSTESPKEGNLC